MVVRGEAADVRNFKVVMPARAGIQILARRPLQFCGQLRGDGHGAASPDAKTGPNRLKKGDSKR